MSQNLLTYEDQYVMQLLINDLTRPQRMGAYEIMGETNEDLVLDDNIELLIPKLCQKSIEELRPYILSAATSNLKISKLFFTSVGNILTGDKFSKGLFNFLPSSNGVMKFIVFVWKVGQSYERLLKFSRLFMIR